MKIPLVVTLCLGLVYGQTIPASTNPFGSDYFSASSVHTLSLAQNVTGTIWQVYIKHILVYLMRQIDRSLTTTALCRFIVLLFFLRLDLLLTSYSRNSTYYTDYYWLWLPFNVAKVRYTLSGSSSECQDTLQAYTQFVGPKQDRTVSLPCVNSNGTLTPFCYASDRSFVSYSYNSHDYSIGSYDFKPGKWQLTAINKGDYSKPPCNYTFSVDATILCPETSTIAVGQDSNYKCVDNGAITNITSNGQSLYTTLASTSQVDVYRIDIPQNITRVWVWVTSTVYTLKVYMTAGIAALDYYYSDSTSVLSSAGSGKYSYLLEYDLPDWDYPLFVSVLPAVTLGSYNISFHWTECSPDTAGLGNLYPTYYNSSSSFIVPDCTYPVIYDNINVLNPSQALTFDVPAFNSSVDDGYAAQYGVINVPTESVGNALFTCNSSIASTFIAFTKGGFTSCFSYSKSLDCDWTGGAPQNDYLYFLSNDLYPGGIWSIVACNSQTEEATVTLYTTYSTPAPSASITPSTSPAAPSPSASPSASPSSSPGSSSTSADSSVSANSILPAVLMIALAALITF